MGAIFEPYLTTKSSGSGLGLLIVRRIVREHGGEISIESEENHGTRVIIHLPRAERTVRLLGAPEPVIDLESDFKFQKFAESSKFQIPILPPMLPTLLIVDDERSTRDGLRSALEEEFDVYTAAGTREALAILKSEPIQLLLTDLRLGGDSGMDLLDAALALPDPPVAIMMTAYGSVDTAVEAMRRGAWHFVTKPLNLDEVEMLLKRALRSRNLETENKQLTQQVKKSHKLDRLIGKSPEIHKVTELIQQVAPTRATILIEGESGTGKEVVASLLHHLSGRPAAKMVTVHCAALSPQLLESELFGHEKGAFTGAAQRRIGRFEQADGGTLFLDEIGEIDAATQIKLLRVLSERTLERVGSNTPDQSGCAGDRRHQQEPARPGGPRGFPRGSVFPAQRGENRHAAAARAARGHRVAGQHLPPGIRQGKRPPGQTAHRRRPPTAALLPVARQRPRTPHRHRTRRGHEQRPRHRHPPSAAIPACPGAARGQSPPPPKNSLAATAEFNLHALEANTIRAALASAGGNRTRAADLLGVSRRTLQRKLQELGL